MRAIAFTLAPVLCCQCVAGTIGIHVLEPPERVGVISNFPVKVGLVLPRDVVAAPPGGALRDDRGSNVVFEADATGWWDPEHSSVKWLLLAFNADTDRRYAFVTGAVLAPPVDPGMATRSNDTVQVDTGPLQVALRDGSSNLFESVTLNGTSMLGTSLASHVLVLDDGASVEETALSDWSLEVEESTPHRACVRGQGTWRDAGGTSVAALDLRCEFFAGEAFARIYHTVTWMIQDTNRGAGELSLRLRPEVGAAGTVKVGLSDYTAATSETAWGAATNLVAFQSSPTNFTLRVNGAVRFLGARMGGWLALEGADGRGAGVALRDAWQTYPTAFSVSNGAVTVGLWPACAPRMAFGYNDLMPDSLFHHPEWKKYRWSKDARHCVPEFETNPYWVHTAEGAARTHELVVFFFDNASRRAAAQLNSALQHPLVLQQDPAEAMKVSFMGFDIAPVSTGAYPVVEQAVDTLGRLVAARWPELHDYGFWRFGMLRWGTPPDGDTDNGLYRWFDGLQYDQQLIPWLLFLRGGGRHFFEEGERTARFGMDVATNHHNTRNPSAYYTSYPIRPGYQSAASCMPFPWSPHFLHKSTKIHFLAYYYHLTGYLRAKDVMDQVIDGASWAAENDSRTPDHPAYRSRGRELYNMNVFWCNAWQETFSPAVSNYAREWLDLTLTREYNDALKVFRSPQIYLYNGLVFQDDLWGDTAIGPRVLENMTNVGFPDMPDGGVGGVEKAMGCGWAYEETGDERYAAIAWDVARTFADLVPVHDWAVPPDPQTQFRGNSFYRHYMLSMLVGLSMGRRLGWANDSPPRFRDTFVAYDMAAPAGRPAVGTAYLRPLRPGDLPVRVHLFGRWGGDFAPVTVSVLDAAEVVVASTTVDGNCCPEIVDRFVPAGYHRDSGELTVPAASKDETYKVRFEGGNNTLTGLLLADAQVVFHVPLGRSIDFQNLAGQSYAGGRVFTMTTDDTVRVTNSHGVPYAIRDAGTWDLLYRTPYPIPATVDHNLGSGRLVAFVVRGRADIMRFESGVSPYFAPTREGWFDPTQ